MARGVGEVCAVAEERFQGDVILASASPGYYSAGGFLKHAGCDVSWMQVGCPRCPTLVNVPVTMAGQMVVCPTCGLSYQVPGYAGPIAPMPPPPPPPQYGAPQYQSPQHQSAQYPSPQHPAPPYTAPQYGAPAYGAAYPPASLAPSAPQPAMEYPPLFAAPAAMSPMPPQPAMPPAMPVAGQPAAAQPPAGLRPVTVLPPPTAGGSAKAEPKRARWQHEKRSQPEPTRPPKAEESPTSMLPPATAKGFRATISDTPGSRNELAMPSVTPAAAAASTGPSAKPSLQIPESALPKSPGAGDAPTPLQPRIDGPARMDLSAVEERLAQSRRKTQLTIAVAVFGLVAMTLFAWFVVNLSRPQ